MQYRRSTSLCFVPEPEGLAAFDFVSGREFGCDAKFIAFLDEFVDWVHEDEARAIARSQFGAEGPQVLRSAIDVGCVVANGSEQAAGLDAFEEQWKWGITSAIFHQSLSRRGATPLDEQAKVQQRKMAERGLVDLVYAPLPGAENVHRLPDPKTDQGVYPHLERRRTVREGVPHRLDIDALSDILFAGVGVTGWTENSVQKLPLKYAPSGGARNPFDAYVLVRDVSGLEPGIYRYSGLDHALEWQSEAGGLTPSAVLNGQDWADCCSCLIMLVANLGRTMWKYEDDDNAYRVVMIEAGHIAQNMMLLAASHDLSLCPSAALDVPLVSKALEITRFDIAPLYGLAVTKPET